MNITTLVGQAKKGDHILYSKINYSSARWYSGVIGSIDQEKLSIAVESSDSRIKKVKPIGKNRGGQVYIVPSKLFTGGMGKYDVEQLIRLNTPSRFASDIAQEVANNLESLMSSYTTKYLSNELKALLISKQNESDIAERLTLDVFDTINEYPYFSQRRIEELRRIHTDDNSN